MNAIERRAAVGLALIYATRMLGLFMILPVFALYADELLHVTPFLIGLAIGIYGLTQALLQIPFGAWSDKIGRKPVIIFGLALFALGSVLAAMSDSIYGVIIGRALQGSGAIAAAIMALASDLTRDEHRTKVMAIIGASIGVAFMLALVIGPVLNAAIGVKGIFWFTAVLAGVAILIIRFAIPEATIVTHQEQAIGLKGMGLALQNLQLLRLDLGIFILHMVLTAIFVVVPVILRDQYSIDPVQHWQIYLAVLISSLVLLVPTILISAKFKLTKPVFLVAILLCAAGQISMGFGQVSFTVFLVAMIIYFWGFNYLEASLPSLVSKYCEPGSKGVAMGVFSSSQFLGAFFGGIVAGLLVTQFEPQAVFMFAFIMFLAWFLVAFTMQTPMNYGSYTVDFGGTNITSSAQLAKSLQGLPGVVEATVIAEEGVAYLKIEQKEFDEEKVKALCEQLM